MRANQKRIRRETCGRQAWKHPERVCAGRLFLCAADAEGRPGARGDRMSAFLLCMMHLRAGRRKRSCPLHGARLLCPDSV